MKNKHWRAGGYLAVFLCLIGVFLPSAAKGQEAKARETAEELIGRLAKAESIGYLSLTYVVELDTVLKVRLKTFVTLEKRLVRPETGESKGAGDYLASFILEPPLAQGAWSWLAMKIYGYESEDYKDMVKSLNVRVEELFLPGAVFKTVSLKQLIREKNYANQTPIEVIFHDERIEFWPDAADKTKGQLCLPYAGQVGPLTGFFNYLLRYAPNESFIVVNVLNSVYDTGETDPATGLKFKVVDFMFRDEPVVIDPGGPETGAPYPYLIGFRNDNFLDIVYGKISFALIEAPTKHEKVPYLIAVDGVFSKSKMQRRDEDLMNLKKKRLEISDTEYERELRRIENRNVLGAWNVRCYLSGFNLNGLAFPKGEN